MNIDNSIGMALFSGELGGIAVTGSLQGSANGMAGSPEGSLFQQLINQMLTTQNQAAAAESVNLKTGLKNQSGETDGLLSALILAGGNPSNSVMQEMGEAAEITSSSEEKQETGENAGAMEMLQALMAGMSHTANAAGVDKAYLGNLAAKPEAPQPEAISSISDVPGNMTAAEIMKQTAADVSTQSGMNAAAVTTDVKPETAAAAKGTTDVQPAFMQIPEEKQPAAQTGSRSESAVLISGKTAAENKIESQETDNTVPGNERPEIPREFEPQSILTPKAAVGNQPAASESLTLEESAVTAEKPKLEIEAADGADPNRTGYQNSVLGALTTGDIAETVTQDQTVESMQPYSQIREEILSKLEKNSPTEFKMQLQPEDLGQIDIKLKLSEGKLVIDILAADSRTQALLTNQVDKLISSMGLQNVQVESVQVSQQMNSQTQDNSQSQGFTMNSAMDFSQRRQQEQNRQEILNNGNTAGAFNLHQDEEKTNNKTNRIETIRFDNHRINYSV